jgi:hypothetical protein
LAKIDAVTVAAIETGVPALAIARDLMERFHCILRARDIGALPRWFADTGNSMLASCGKGIAADLAAMKAALIEPWSNGQTEGQITKLKLVKRQMYGRAHLDLLRARLLVSVRRPPPNCTEIESEPQLHAETQSLAVVRGMTMSMFHLSPSRVNFRGLDVSSSLAPREATFRYFGTAFNRTPA